MGRRRWPSSAAMGQGHGTLQGAYARNSLIPPLPSPLPCVAAQSRASAGGVTLTVQAGGGLVNVVIPDGLGPGDTFNVSVPDNTRVICSNLPTVPGHEIVLAKPIIWATDCAGAPPTRSWVQEKAGSLLQKVQAQLIQQAIQQVCNAVLGVTFNVSSETYGGVQVTILGTPCFVAPRRSLPGHRRGRADRDDQLCLGLAAPA